MMKKTISLFFVLFMLVSSLSKTNAHEKIDDVQTIEQIPGITDCQLFAYYAGFYAQTHGGDFYSVYFAAYSHCMFG